MKISTLKSFCAYINKICICVTVIILLIIYQPMFIAGCRPKSVDKAPKDMAFIPAGEFFMGVNESSMIFDVMSDKLEGKDSMPQHKVYLDDFYIDVYETTYKDYAKYEKRLQNFIYGKEYYPVSGVSWYEADNYCRWRKKALPSEQQWEKAARGTKGITYTWGNRFDPSFANLGKRLAFVGSYINDKSPYGVYDMVGNVSEWTSSWYLPYPNSSYKSPYFGKNYKVARGGSYSKDDHHSYIQIFSQVTFRSSNPPDTGAFDTGFRCALNI